MEKSMLSTVKRFTVRLKIYNQIRNFKEAEASYLEAKDVFEKTLGPETPVYAKNLDQYSGTVWRHGGF